MRDGHAHDLAARLRERVDLREVRRDVGRRGVQHGLHDDGRAAAERHGAHRHPAGSLARFGMRCHKSLPFSIPHRVQARCRNSVSTARRLHAPKRVAGYFTSDYPVSGQMHRDFAGGPPEPHWRARAAKNARISQVRELCAPPSCRNDRFGRSRAFPFKKTPGQKFSLTYFDHAVRFRSAHNSWTWCFSSDFDDGSAHKSRTCAPTATPNGSRALRTLARAARSNRRNPHPR